MEVFRSPNEPFTYGNKVSKQKSLLEKDWERSPYSVDKAN